MLWLILVNKSHFGDPTVPKNIFIYTTEFVWPRRFFFEIFPGRYFIYKKTLAIRNYKNYNLKFELSTTTVLHPEIFVWSEIMEIGSGDPFHSNMWLVILSVSQSDIKSITWPCRIGIFGHTCAKNVLFIN